MVVALLVPVVAGVGYWYYRVRPHPVAPPETPIVSSAPAAQPTPPEQAAQPTPEAPPVVQPLVQQPARQSAPRPATAPPPAARSSAPAVPVTHPSASPSPAATPAQTPVVAPPPTPKPQNPPPAQPSARPVEQPPARPAAPAVPASGAFTWSGQLRKNATLTIDGSSASAGSLTGALPGVPVLIEIEPRDLGVVEAPGPGNQWRRLVLRARADRQTVVTIRWHRLGQ